MIEKFSSLFSWLRIVFFKLTSKSHWINEVLRRKTIDDLFANFGKFWLIVVVASFCFPNAKPYLSQNAELLIGTLITISVLVSLPKLHIRKRLNNRDIDIEIRVTNMFFVKGAYVISTNTTFDTDLNPELKIISKDSLQGQLTLKFYGGNVSKLNCDLDILLSNLQYKKLDDTIRVGKNKRYSIGTTLKLSKNNRTFYLLALADLNKHSSVETSFENIQKSISSLWKKVYEAGNIEPIVIPVIGSGKCRLKEARVDFIKEIINSFISECKTKKLCEKLIIVISPSDYKKFDIDLGELEEYLNYKCKFYT